MVYCAGKLIENLIIYSFFFIKAIDHTFYLGLPACNTNLRKNNLIYIRKHEG